MDAIKSGVMKMVSSLLTKTVTSQSRFSKCKEMHSEIEALKFGQDTVTICFAPPLSCWCLFLGRSNYSDVRGAR